MVENNKDTHSGHRERMRKRFRETGSLRGFADHEVLEMLLFYILPRRDTNAIAHGLIKRFNSLKGVMEASPQELMQADSIGENAAYSLHFFSQFMSYVQLKTVESVDVRDFYSSMAYMNKYFLGEREEKFKVACVTSGFRVQSVMDISVGDSETSGLDFRALAKTVLNSGCKSVILAHNHPGNSNNPSQEDVYLTREAQRFLQMLGITVLDHYISGDNGIISMRNCGMIHDMEI